MKGIIYVLSLHSLLYSCVFEIEKKQTQIISNLWLVEYPNSGTKALIWSEDSNPNGGLQIVPKNIVDIDLSNSSIKLSVVKNEKQDTVFYNILLDNYDCTNPNTLIINTSDAHYSPDAHPDAQ